MAMDGRAKRRGSYVRNTSNPSRFSALRLTALSRANRSNRRGSVFLSMVGNPLTPLTPRFALTKKKGRFRLLVISII